MFYKRTHYRGLSNNPTPHRLPTTSGLIYTPEAQLLCKLNFSNSHPTSAKAPSGALLAPADLFVCFFSTLRISALGTTSYESLQLGSVRGREKVGWEKSGSLCSSTIAVSLCVCILVNLIQGPAHHLHCPAVYMHMCWCPWSPEEGTGSLDWCYRQVGCQDSVGN